MQGHALTMEEVMNSYAMLESQNTTAQSQANLFLMNIAASDEAWTVSKKMITQTNDIKYQFLGSQILYLKIVRQLTQLNQSAKQQLKGFIFTQLDNPNLNYNGLIYKLAGSAAYLGSIMSLKQWPTFLKDLIEFMKKSQGHLKKGLQIIERIPEELRYTNKISFGMKETIMKGFLKNSQEIALVFSEVLKLNDLPLIDLDMMTMESWVKSSFPLIKYNQLIKQILLLSLESEDLFQRSVNVILESIKSVALSKNESLTEIDPSEELNNFLPSEIQSIKLIIQYITEKKQTFLGAKIDTKYRQIYIEMIKETILNFSFLLMEDIGIHLLQIMLSVARSNELKLSWCTFQFWIDFSEQSNKIKLPNKTQQIIWKTYQELFDCVNSKVIVENQYLLDDPDLKEDATIDDLQQMSFSEYRKQSTTLYKFIYDYFKSVSKKPTSFFQKLFKLIEIDFKKGVPHKYTQLALFCVKSAIQSMISPEDALNIRKIITYVIDSGVTMPARVSAELMNLVRDCTKQIRQDQQLFMKCLRFSLAFIQDEKLCHYAAYCFQILMEAMGTVNDPSIVMNLIQFYHSKNFPKETIIQQILQGIISVIVKLQSKENIVLCLEKLLSQIYQRFNTISTISDQEKPYIISLLQLKVVLNSYELGEKEYKENFISFYKQVANQGLKMVQLALPYCLKNDLKVLTYNELGLSCLIYKNALKICGTFLHQRYLHIIELSLSVLTVESIVEKYGLVGLLSETLVVFAGNNVQLMNSWLINHIPSLNAYFFKNFKNIEILDPDILKWFFGIQEGLLLYNPDIFLSLEARDPLIQIALYALRHINQKNMQRKVINFLFLYCQQEHDSLAKWHEKIIQNVFSSIPIINTIWHHMVSRIIINLTINYMNKQNMFAILLKKSPYQDFPPQLVAMFSTTISTVVEHRHERYLKNIFNDLSEYARSTIVPHMLRSLEIRYEVWKRELNRKK